ncbi:MerC domain-containing protein [Xanthomonas hortorum]|uniref:MerC domain-containing protein n=1 Tax=Xanthomonas hortorum TaxID=56454 RepID=UPI0029363D8C|nr:MerC domain-containing protein [Xanthomonas hortorum]MDV2450812.1 MerC domain-containing protein [Xanthomonas hortorum NBC5720]
MRVTASVLDRSAIALSSLCLLHCLALPLLAAALPLLGAWSRAEWVHVVFATAAVPLSGYALWSSHRRHALPAPVWALAAFGLAGLVLGASGVAGGTLETPITVTGSLLLASTHLVNLRLRRRAGHCAS